MMYTKTIESSTWESDLKSMKPNSSVSDSVVLMKEKELKEKELMIEQVKYELCSYGLICLN